MLPSAVPVCAVAYRGEVPYGSLMATRCSADALVMVASNSTARAWRSVSCALIVAASHEAARAAVT